MEKTSLIQILNVFKSRMDILSPTGNPFFLACSGGKDSMLLANLLLACNIPFELVHINYNWRIEAQNDEEWLSNWADLNAVKFHSYQAGGKDGLLQMFPGLSSQEAARKYRYKVFEQLSLKNQNAIVLTAHHAGDQRETILMRILEGRAVNPIPQIRPPYYRPMLDFEPELLEELRLHYKVQWREDKSNSTNDYRRNKFRNIVIPALNQLDFNWKAGLHHFLIHHTNALQAETMLLEKLKEQILKENGLVLFPLNVLQEHKNRITSLIRLGEILIAESEVSCILNVLNAQKGSKVFLKQGTLWKEKQSLIFIDNKINKEHLIIYPSTLYDSRLVCWIPGDRLKKPDGSHRKISDWLNDVHCPAFLKEGFQVLKTNGEVTWPLYHTKIEFRLTSGFLERI